MEDDFETYRTGIPDTIDDKQLNDDDQPQEEDAGHQRELEFCGNCTSNSTGRTLERTMSRVKSSNLMV